MGLFDAFSDVFGTVVDTFTGAIDAMVDVADAVVDTAADVVSGTVDVACDLGDGLASLGDSLLDLAGDTVEGVIGLAGDIGEGVGTVVSDVTDGVGEMVGGFLSLLDGDDSETQAAREAMERRLAAMDRELGEKEAAYTALVGGAAAALAAGASTKARQARQQLQAQLQRDFRMLGEAIGRGKARKAELKQQIDGATGAQRRALVAELRTVARAMQPLYDQLKRTSARQQALRGR